MRIRSIRRFLLWTLLPAVLLVSGGVATWTYLMSAHEVEELFDAELAQTARVLAGLIDREMLEQRAEALADALERARPGSDENGAGASAVHPYETKLSFQLLDSSGTLLFAAPGAPGGDLGPLSPGFSWVPQDDFRWRVFTLENPREGLWIRAAQRDDIREELAGQIAVDLLLQSLLALPLLALIVPLVVAAAFRPVRKIASELNERAPANLQPVDIRATPAEIRGLVGALNRMFHRLAVAFAAERRFTADAAHELRTPVAGLLVNADNALSAPDEASRRASVRRVAAGARRVQRLVEQLLTLSRLDPEAGLGQWETVDMVAVVADQLNQIHAEAANRRIRLELAHEGRCACPGNATMLGVLVRNLVENALRHTPDDGSVTVAVRDAADWVELTVADTGPGIPPELRARAVERFYRVAGQQLEGSGLGLSIVARIAEIHGATLALEDAPGQGGLLVRLRLPSARDRARRLAMPPGGD